MFLAEESRKIAVQSTALATESQKLATLTAELTRQSVRDSSAMKTIAVMTMLFLPGTFFAALFSLPLLKWDASNVVQTKFWIYWVFTVPTTVLVFAAWRVLTMEDPPFHCLKPRVHDVSAVERQPER